MRVLDRIAEVRKELDTARADGRSIGFVPTMGALHEGHASLIRRSAAECERTIVSIFVNPLQFGPAEDFALYPRDLDADLDVATAAGADLVFAPPVEEMYPAPMATAVHVAGVGEGLEAASRPGHFRGVATVVAKLFAIAGTCRAYFGEKDYQQLLVVRRLAADLSLPVDIVGCPTVREPDGLARSSRNAYLSPAERGAATALYQALETAAGEVSAGERSADRLRAAMGDILAASPPIRPDYAEVADPLTLEPLARVEGQARLLVAATVGTTRLIDNRGVRV
ncbi:MAG: pantoate--beta-alanine ligase [Actinobacteria bacterium]|nr:pantoate--beta-alanine ligase [Actinomycetota bacterium]